MPKFNIEKNNICDEKVYCYKHQKCNLQCKNKKNDRIKVIMYVLGLISIYNMKKRKCVKESEVQNLNKEYSIYMSEKDISNKNKSDNFSNIDCIVSFSECQKCKLNDKNIRNLLNIYIKSIKQLILIFYNAKSRIIN